MLWELYRCYGSYTDVMGVICNVQMLWELYVTYRCYGSYM